MSLTRHTHLHIVPDALARLTKAEFARHLTALRETRYTSQTEAAKAIGVSYRTYSRWESTEDPTEPFLSSLEKIAVAFQVQIEELLPPDQESFATRLVRVEAKIDGLAHALGAKALQTFEEQWQTLLEQAAAPATGRNGQEQPAPKATPQRRRRAS